MPDAKTRVLIPAFLSLCEREQEIVAQAVRLMPQLTGREQQVARLVAASYTNGGIARELHLSPNTIQTYLRDIYAKVGLGDKEAVKLLNERALLIKAYQIYRDQDISDQVAFPDT